MYGFVFFVKYLIVSSRVLVEFFVLNREIMAYGLR